MSKRYFEGNEHVKLYSKYRPSYPHDLIEKIINYLKEKDNGPYELAIDVGCGSGQASWLLSPYFNKVIGYDVSENQIKQAKFQCSESSNVNFVVSPSEKLPLPDGSVNLIIVATAIHWFQMEKFFIECKRVLKKNGTLAIFGHLQPRIIHKEKSTELTKCLTDYTDLLLPYSPKEIHYILNKYEGINPLILGDIERNHSFYMDCNWNVEYIMQYLQTLGIYQNYCDKNPNNSIIETIKQRFHETLEAENIADTEKTELCIRFDIALILCRNV